ncbi:LLM class flavin-dependent oxidoreductase [Emticicia sp. 17c]|uniref:LLM class flavin-dependent oxidoreductase n=1 Tax=Emticicia sp. 17c TaxID=3127704 RepID=UPI00301C5020
MEKLSFGILDFGMRQQGLNSLMKLDDVVKSAIDAEHLGYSRYWISEHHFSQKSLAWSNPQAVVPILASSTNRIKIGVAGVLLGMYSPYHVATFFKMLNNVFQRRIDLGIANGSPSSRAVSYAMEYDKADMKESFEDKFSKLIHYLRDDDDLYEEGKGVVVPPYKGYAPEVWTLSTSAYRTAERVINLQLNLSRSICHEMSEKDFAKEKLQKLKEDYRQKHGVYPKVNLVVGIICHKTMKKAQQMAENYKAAGDYLNIVGCPSYFKEKIFELRESYGVDEFILYNYSVNTQERALSMRLISKEFNL